ncbi:hypothetical protein O0L34_g15365 [Tuta absoluta]|nr:hypothetical protein O0L34_g15365 [Tuta absoluta]
MCTISECLRHDAPAVWAHILPLIEKAITLNPFLDTIHFMSDSPTSQYRNKCVFFFISQLKNDFEQLKTITWNYSEVGHGKGAPDGVGAVIKRTVDRMVNFGEDVGTFQQFCEVLDKNIDNVSIKVVQEEDVLEREKLIPSNLKPFRGTFDTYQALWTDLTSNQVTMRKMCCFECEAFDICKHNNHIGFYDIDINAETDKKNTRSDASAAKSIVSLSSTKLTSKKRKIQGDLCDVSNENPRPSTSKASSYVDQFTSFIDLD